MLQKIKSFLENRYFFEFVIEGNSNSFQIKPSNSENDKFIIEVLNKDGVRLYASVKPEMHGANIISILNSSDIVKRNNFVELWKSNKIGTIKVKINDKEIKPNELMNNDEWKSFVIEFVEFPFNNSLNEIIRVVSLLCDMFLSILNYDVEGYEEGRKIDYHCTKYERNPINRRICLSAKGYKCAICGFDFEKQYGEVGKECIEVHHSTPVSEMPEDYIVKPLIDLIPVCSNCHTIIHKRKPAYSSDEVKKMIESK